MIKSVLLKRCYDSIKAHFYVNELNSRGIYAFIFNEHVTDLIPFGDGGYLIHVNIDQLDEAATIIEELERNEQVEETFHDANHDDIAYEKLKTEREADKAKRHKITMAILVIAIALVLLKYLFDGKVL